MKLLPVFFLSLLFLTGIEATSFAQCMVYPVSLEQRVRAAAVITLGEVVSKDCFTQKENGLIYTRNIIEVKAWLKGKQTGTKLALLTLGGIDGDQAMIAYPAVQLETGKEYVFLLESGNQTKEISKSIPQNSLPVFTTYADVQGALLQNNFVYDDVVNKRRFNEEELFTEIETLTGMPAVKTDGSLFAARKPTFKAEAINTVSGFSPSATNAGTIVPGDFLTITGINFEAVRGAGFVAFRNADNGGSNYIVPAVASDYVSWSATSITVKVPPNAGTGDFFVRTNGGVDFFSPSNLTVNYAHTSIDNTFLNFATSTRQRYYLRNLNGQGGYSLTFNTTFNSNAAAKSSFNRALITWRCNTGFNINTSSTTSAVATAANDNINIVSFDSGLPAGVLARATSYFSGSGINGVCDMANTVWWLRELDIVFNNPPAAGFTWQFGPAAPSASQYDFESVALHEVGHLHGLGHIIAPGLVMHYALSNGSSVRTLAARDIAAGNAKMNYSTAATCFNPASAGTPMTAVPGGSCTTLPVILSSFSGKRLNTTTNLLNWETEQEFNNDGFTVERSDDSRIFSPLKFIKGRGNSSQKTSYSFNDAEAGPFKRYYRLAQKDYDGRVTYSTVVPINGDATPKWKIWLSGSTLFLYNSLPLEQTATLEVFNSSGQLVFSKQIISSSVSFPVQLTANAVYTYRLVTKKEIISGKLTNLF
jgi:hypothetical protein